MINNNYVNSSDNNNNYHDSNDNKNNNMGYTCDNWPLFTPPPKVQEEPCCSVGGP